MQENEFKRAYVRLAVDRVFPLLQRQLAALDKIAHDLPEVHVHALVALEPEIEPDAEDVVRAVGLDAVAPRVRLVGDGHADEPVRRGPLGVLVEDGVENVAVDGIHVPGLIEKDEVVRERRERRILMEGIEIREIIADRQACGVLLLELRAAPPYDHDEKEHERHEHRDIPAEGEFAQRREEEHRLDRAEHERDADRKRLLFLDAPEIHREKERRHKHRHGDGETVSRLHARARPEVEHYRRAAEIQHRIDRADVDLPLRVRGVAHLKVRHEIEPDGLGHERVRARDERLRCDDRRERAERDGRGAQRLRQHLEERVHVGNGGERAGSRVRQYPRALAEIVQDQARLHKRPARINVPAADVAHIGIERLRAGRGEEHAAEDHKARLVIGRNQNARRVHRVERAQHAGTVENAADP